MNTFSSSSIFEQMSNSYFLYYSWIELRGLKNLNNLESGRYKPISLLWFKKASQLLRKGLYVYRPKKFTKLNKIGFKETIMFSFRDKVIENAVFNVIFPFFNIDFAYKKTGI